ncbi:hypothetical protein [Streptomyces profundus]|uniref:hypothetical protein n=1 Tax=Streptomyces profundus TaxID=2867410 RepID=UPI001D1606E0|nr:hypothetical protein [Streptomyces sp. MA3_2.13]UED84271.1 hypothetical protein K4G22_08665 [Streptomyces sp. MA3_2.13]
MSDSLSSDLWTGERDAPAAKARAAARQVRERAGDQAEGQTHRAADQVRRIADELAELARQAPEDSPTRGLVSQAANGGHRAASYLDEHGVDGLLENTQRFARQRPTAFVGATALAGFAVGRLAKAGLAAGGATSRDGENEGADEPAPVDRITERGPFDTADHPERTGYPEA